MKKIFLVFPVILVFLTACTRTKSEFWPNGAIKSEITLKDNHYEGPAKFYYETGQIQISCTYKNDKLHGQYLIFYPDGQRKEEQNFWNGVQVGSNKVWDSQGTLIKTANYSDGKLNGRFTEFWPNGSVMTEGEFKNGFYHGYWLYHDYSGSIAGYAKFHLGAGFQKAVYPDGSVRQITPFSNNLKDGEELFFSPDGKIQKINKYIKGQLFSVKTG